MDIPLRIITAFSIIGGGLVIGLPILFVQLKRHRREKLRRRGIKDYNRSGARRRDDPMPG